MTKKLIGLCALLLGAYVFATAPRKVTINSGAYYSSSSSSSQGIILNNGSSTTVNYKISCYDKNGTSTFTKTGLSLSSKAMKTHAGNVECSNGATKYNSFTGGAVLCGWNNSPTPSNCPTNFNICTYNQVKAIPFNSTYNDTYYYSGWTSDFSFSVSGTWSYGYTSNSSTTWFDQTDTNYPPFASNNPYTTCNNATNGSGGSSLTYCASHYYNAGTFCCPTANAELLSYSCDVEIDSTTPSNGFLQSPQFKANAPF